MRFIARVFVAITMAAVTAACASLPPNGGRSAVEALTQERGRSAPATDEVRQLVALLPDRKLSATDAIHIALVNSPRVRGLYADLGLAAAEVYEAGRLSNPRLSASALFPSGAGQAQLTVGLAQSFTDLLLLGRRRGLAEKEFQSVQHRAGAEILEIASDVEAAYYDAVGAEMIVTIRRAISSASTTSAELAQRFYDAGNIPKLQLAQEQAAAAQAAIALLDAQADLTDARATLNELMGLRSGNTGWRLPAALPTPAAVEDQEVTLVQLADTRLDLLAARSRVGSLAEKLGVTRSFRYLGDIELGIETEREVDGERLTGPTLELELPLFNGGAGRAASAQAELERAEAELAALEIEVSNKLRRNSAAVASARSRVDLYRTTLVPLQESVVARTQEQVNFMLAGQFELLLAKKDEYEAYEGLLTALKDYWLARTELTRSVGAQLPSSSSISSEALDAAQLTAPAPVMPMDHGQRGDMQMPSPAADHSGHGKAPTGALHQHDPASSQPQRPLPKPKASATSPKPRKKSEMPTGMEGHIPETAPESADPHSHGEH